MAVKQDNDKPYDAFEHLCQSTFDDPKRGIMAYLTVYSDASYNQPTKQNPNPRLLHTVGAYVASVDDWRRFRKEWKQELDWKDLDHFHMTDYEYARNAIISGKTLKSTHPYCGWKVGDFDLFLQRLHKVINRKKRDGSYRLEAFLASVCTTDFEKVLPGELKDDPGFCSPYMFNVVMNMMNIRRWADENRHNDPIHYVFAGGDGQGNNLERWFDYCWRDRYARKRFRLDKGYSRIGYKIEWMKAEPALQAADIAAFEFNKVALKADEKQTLALDMGELRKSLPSLCQTHHYTILATENQLRDGFAKFPFKQKE